MEYRTGLEIRADGRTLVGAAMRYGDLSPSHRERWEPGAARVSPDLAPTLGHRTGRVLAYGSDVEVEDRPDALIVRARLPRTEVAEEALAGVANGRYRGWSVEFRPERERRDPSGIRVIERAAVPGLALVDAPSFPGSTVEARRRLGPTLRGSVPTGRALDCRCPGGECDTIEFSPDAFAGLEEALATTGRMDQTVGRAILTPGRSGSPLDIEVELLDVAAARDLVSLISGQVPIFLRPLVDLQASDIVEGRNEGGVLVVRKAVFGAVLCKPVSGGVEGLDPATVAGETGNRGGLVGEASPVPLQTILTLPRRNRLWL